MGDAFLAGREHRLHVRRREQPVLGGTVRKTDRRRGSLGQALWQLAYRVVQGPRHDRAGLGGEANDRRASPDSRRCLRFHGRHLGRAGGVLRGGGDPGDRLATTQQGVTRSTRATARQRCARTLARHGFRRLHEDRAGDHPRQHHLSGKLDEQPAHRGSEDRGHRARPAIRLGGPRLGGDPGRQSRQRQRARARAS